MASAAARLCFLAGFRVVVLERDEPLAVRRRVCFAEAVRSGRAEVEGVPGRAVEAAAPGPSRPEFVEVAVDPDGHSVRRLRPAVLVDGRMAKSAGDTTRAQAAVVIGLGPGFVAGRDVHAVVETQRGPALGRVLWAGAAEPDTGVPGAVGGVADARVMRAPRAGRFNPLREIGDLVRAGEAVGDVAGEPVRAGVDGLVRGLLAGGVAVDGGVKVGDVDPRGRAVDPAAISDKARAVAAGVLEAVFRCAGG